MSCVSILALRPCRQAAQLARLLLSLNQVQTRHLSGRRPDVFVVRRCVERHGHVGVQRRRSGRFFFVSYQWVFGRESPPHCRPTKNQRERSPLQPVVLASHFPTRMSRRYNLQGFFPITTAFTVRSQDVPGLSSGCLLWELFWNVCCRCLGLWLARLQKKRV